MSWLYNLPECHGAKVSEIIDSIELPQQVAREVHHRFIELQPRGGAVRSQFKPRAAARQQRTAFFADARFTTRQTGDSARARPINGFSA